MGKTSKKTKSDRINALRKQYDAFLDEDKKRKDRNEFILGSLEKMRLYSPAVVPFRYITENPLISKYHFVTQERPGYLRKVSFDDDRILRSRKIDVSPDSVTKDEGIMLQEIGKKYILIPKLRPTNENSVTYNTSENNDADWRNKYNILEELKKIEKEGLSEVSKDKPDLTYNYCNNDHELGKAASKNITEHRYIINKDPTYNTQQNSQKIEVTQLKSHKIKTIRTNDLDNNIDCNTLFENDQNIISDNVKNTDFGNEVLKLKPGFDLTKQGQHHISDSNEINKELYPHENVVKVENRNENKNDKKLIYDHIQDIQQNEVKAINDTISINTDTANVTNEPHSQTNTLELSSTEIVDSNITKKINDKENTELHLEKDTVAHPVENVKNEVPCASVDLSDSVSDHIQQQEHELTNEMTIISEDVIPSQIEEFEAEQKDMFYSEKAEYNQHVDTLENTTQNEEYTNEQYPYYNESQQDQPYYAEINEHEESTDRYDPNYEQQYVNNSYEDVAHYENQQHEVDNYDNQQEVTNVNYEPQPDQQEVTNVNYEDHPHQQEATSENYEPQPVNNYEFEHSSHHDNPDQTYVDNANTFDSQASEHVNYENQLYDEMVDVEHPPITDQNVYETQEDYVKNTEHETIQNLEQQYGEGHTEPKNTFPNKSSTEVEIINGIESNIEVP